MAVTDQIHDHVKRTKVRMSVISQKESPIKFEQETLEESPVKNARKHLLLSRLKGSQMKILSEAKAKEKEWRQKSKYRKVHINALLLLGVLHCLDQSDGAEKARIYYLCCDGSFADILAVEDDDLRICTTFLT